MHSIDPRTNTEKENYKLLTGTILPRPIAFVTTRAENGIVNGAPFSYFNVVSSKPPLISLAIQRRNGEMKDTARNILREGEFVVHGVDIENVEKINGTSATLPPEESEVERMALTLLDSDVVGVPGIEESKVRLECILEQALSFPAGDAISVDLIIGRVVRYHIEESIYEAGRIDLDALQPVSRLAGTNYAPVGVTFSLKRPE